MADLEHHFFFRLVVFDAKCPGRAERQRTDHVPHLGFIIGVHSHTVLAVSVEVEQAVIVIPLNRFDLCLDLQQSRGPRQRHVVSTGITVDDPGLAIGRDQAWLHVTEHALFLLPGAFNPQLDEVLIGNVGRQKVGVVNEYTTVRQFNVSHESPSPKPFLHLFNDGERSRADQCAVGAADRAEDEVVLVGMRVFHACLGPYVIHRAFAINAQQRTWSTPDPILKLSLIPFQEVCYELLPRLVKKICNTINIFVT